MQNGLKSPQLRPKKIRIKLFPFDGQFYSNRPKAALLAAIGMAIAQMILPLI
jgi:hypothetical protein